MNIRKATYEDIPRIMEICDEARSIMRSDGNMTQWTGGYPSEDIISKDIGRAVGYVIESGDGSTGNEKDIVGYFAFIPGIEMTYLEIEGGSWIDDIKPYCTIHRLASTKASRGVARACFEWCREQCGNLRVDTHEDNRIMRRCIERAGFTYCGIIHLADGAPRLAYQKIPAPRD